MTFRSAVLAGDFFPPLFHVFSAVQDLSSYDPSECLLSVSYLCFGISFLPSVVLLTFPLLPAFCRLMPFLSFLSIFICLLLSSPTPFFFCSDTLSCCLFSDISVQSPALLYLPLHIFSPHCSFGHRCPPSLPLYIHVCIHLSPLHIFHSPAEAKK